MHLVPNLDYRGDSVDAEKTTKDKAPSLSEVKAAEKRLDEKTRKLKELQREINEAKAKITKGRRSMDTKFSILIGRYIRSDLGRMTALLDSPQFQNYLNARDKEFVRVARGVLYPDKEEDGKEQQQQKAQVQPQTDTNEKSEEATKIQAGPPKGMFVIEDFDGEI